MAKRIVISRGDFPFEVMPAAATIEEAAARCKELYSGPENVERHMQWGFGRVDYSWSVVPEYHPTQEADK